MRATTAVVRSGVQLSSLLLAPELLLLLAPVLALPQLILLDFCQARPRASSCVGAFSSDLNLDSSGQSSCSTCDYLL
jgi:hypothetical protein